MEKQIETLSEILSLVRFFDTRINSLSYDLMEAQRLNLDFYAKLCEKSLNHARRGSKRLKDRYNRYLKSMDSFIIGGLDGK